VQILKDILEKSELTEENAEELSSLIEIVGKVPKKRLN